MVLFKLPYKMGKERLLYSMIFGVVLKAATGYEEFVYYASVPDL